jgi:hypothetical protein
MHLKTLTPITSEDGQYIRISAEGSKGEKTTIDMPTTEFFKVMELLVEFSIQIKANEALSVQNLQTETPAQSHALLLAKTVQLVRWETDACLLQIESTLGAALQIGLSKDQAQFLQKSLNKNI